MMKIINQKNKCNACHNIVKWNCIVYDEKIQEHIKREGMQAEEIIAIDEVKSNEGVVTEYAAIVKCPFCNTKNKFLMQK